MSCATTNKMGMEFIQLVETTISMLKNINFYVNSAASVIIAI